MSNVVPCAACGKLLTHTTLPIGQATCYKCRQSKPGSHTGLTCADCGQPMWRGKDSQPQGRARCRACRGSSLGRAPRKQACLDCGAPSWGLRCRKCSDRHQRIRSNDDHNVRRWHRELAAPGLLSRERRALLAKWKRQRKGCAYCGQPPTTVDHVLPLIRGGTNHEGNLAPCCKVCNSSKAGLTLIEWRTGGRLGQMATALPWVYLKRERKPRAKPPTRKWIQTVLQVCPVCKAMHIELGSYCSADCKAERNRRRMRDMYRARKGLPVDPDKPTKPWLRLALAG